MNIDPRTRRLGALSLLAAVATAAPGSAQSFQLQPGQIPQGSPFNNSNSEGIGFADVDLDGDWDAAIGDGGDCCNDQNRMWINMGNLQAGAVGLFQDQTGTRFPSILETNRDLDFVDIDADGDQDLYLSATSQISNQSNLFWENNGGAQGGTLGFFSDQTASHWINIAVNNGTTSSSIPNSLSLGSGGFIDWSCDCMFADLDNDGDMDLFHSTYGGTFTGNVPSRVFLNNGSGGFEEFNPSGFQLTGTTIANGNPALWAEGTQSNNTSNTNGTNADIAMNPLGIDLGDLDGDFDIDLIHGSRNTRPRAFFNRLEENGGTLGFRDRTNATLMNTSNVGNYENELGDFDADGDLDLYGLNWTGGFSDLVKTNPGDGDFNNSAFTTLSGSGADDNEGDFFDFNNDGNLDIYVCNFSGGDKLYRGGGTQGGFVNVTGPDLPNFGNTGLAADSADVDNDGDQDLLVGNDAGQQNRYLENVTQVADALAPYLPSIEQAPDRTPSATPTVVRVQVYDNASWDVTQFYSASLEYQVNGGSVTSAPLVYAGANIFRGEIPGALSGVISYQATATDGSGNTGASATLAFTSGSCSGATSTYCTSKTTSIPGCTPSITFSGSPSIGAGSGFDVMAGPVPGNNPGLFIYTTNGPAASPISNAFGFLCVNPGPGLFRIAFQNGGGTNGTCSGAYSVDFNAHAATQTQDANLVAGAQVDLQVWYRDPANVGTANLTEAGQFVLCP